MRKYVVIAVAALIVVVGGVLGAKSWLATRARQSEVERKVAAARELMRVDADENGQPPAEWSKAAVELDAALLLAPDDVQALLARGEVAWMLKLVNDAIRHLDRAEQLSQGSEHAAVQLARGRAYATRFEGTGKDEDFRTARNAFQDARGDPVHSDEATFEYGALFIATKRVSEVEKGIATWEELLKRRPDYPGAEGIRGLIESLRGTKSARGGG